MSSRQDIIDKLKELGANPKKSLGQNFLVGDYVIHKIINQVNVGDDEAIIEVGPGLGALTQHLKEKTKYFKVIELDRIFSQYWRDQEIEVIEADALRVDWSELTLRPTHLVSNLPYQISSSLVIEISQTAPLVKTMLLMFQKEVAQRLLAEPNCKAYGLLSVVAQAHWYIRPVLEAGPNEFYPSPKIASRVLGFTRREGAPEGPFVGFVKSAFAQRRKKLIKNIASYSGAREALESLELDDNIRAEALTVNQFIELYRLCGRGH